MKKLELYIDKDGQKLRCGYTTGSCATAATKAAASMLLTGEIINEIEISTPSGIDLFLHVENQKIEKDFAEASIKKDAGDDPDSTDGIEIFSRVKLRTDEVISIDGGEGIGRITKKGIYGEIGDAAINPVPKQMIIEELRKLSPNQGFDVLIYAPEGVNISKRTFNKNIGIEGGISIIGTKGIVYPMSEEALLKTIYMEIESIKLNQGLDEYLILVPGNHGEKHAEEIFENPKSVQVSNYIGKALKYAYNLGFRKFCLIGHVGKFSKLSLGAYDTHNEVVDLRMEAFVYYLAMEDIGYDIFKEVNGFLSGEEASLYLIENNLGWIIGKMEKGAETRIKKYLKDEDIEVIVKMYTMKRGFKFD